MIYFIYFHRAYQMTISLFRSIFFGLCSHCSSTGIAFVFDGIWAWRNTTTSKEREKETKTYHITHFFSIFKLEFSFHSFRVFVVVVIMCFSLGFFRFLNVNVFFYFIFDTPIQCPLLLSGFFLQRFLVLFCYCASVVAVDKWNECDK